MIKQVRVQNFKSLRDVSLSLGLRNVLVGPNMAGKSNLLDLFRFLTWMTLPMPGEYGLPKALTALGGFSEVVWKGGDSRHISIALDGEWPITGDSTATGSWHYEITILGDPTGAPGITVQDEVLRVTENSTTYSLIDKVEGQRVLKQPDGHVLSRITDRERSGLEFEIPDCEGNKARRYISSWRFYDLEPKQMKQANPTAAAAFLAVDGQNLSAWLMMLQTRFPESFAKIRQVAKDVFPEVEELFTWPTPQATVFLASRERHLSRPVGAWQMANGQLSFIALLSLIYCPPELGAGLYCIEEPENHLHPKLLETLVELLAQVQEEYGPANSAQLIVTTHSPHLVDRVGLDELIVLERRDGATSCVRPSDKQHLRELLEREEIGLGDLYYSGALSNA